MAISISAILAAKKPAPKPVQSIAPTHKIGRGRPPIGEKAMTPAERKRRERARKAQLNQA